MELFRVGAPLLRSSQPLLPFLAPSACRPSSRRAIDAVSRQRPAFSTSKDRRAESPSQAYEDDISSLLDGALDGNKGTPAVGASRTSRFKSSSAQTSNPPSRVESQAGRYQPKPGSSVDDLLAAMGSRSTSSSFQRRSGGNDVSGFRDIASMLDVNAPARPSTAASRRNADLPPSIPAIPEKPLPFKLNASVGRSVTVDSERGMDVGRAFRTLEIQCARNSVRKDFMRQRFHERAGLKRKRLRSERWRRRFKEEFKGTIAMVQKMRAQGW